jgi:hypothetical protein
MSSQPEALDNIFSRLGSKSEDVRMAAAEELKTHINSSNIEFPGDDTKKNVWKEVFHRTFELTRSNTTAERLGSIAAIDAMLEETNNDSPDRALQNNIRLYGYLRPLLTYPDSTVMVAAAHVVGNMVKLAGANLGESFFNKEVGQAIQMIDGGWRHMCLADIRLKARSRPLQRRPPAAPVCSVCAGPVLPLYPACPGEDLDPIARQQDNGPRARVDAPLVLPGHHEGS